MVDTRRTRRRISWNAVGRSNKGNKLDQLVIQDQLKLAKTAKNGEKIEETRKSIKSQLKFIEQKTTHEEPFTKHHNPHHHHSQYIVDCWFRGVRGGGCCSSCFKKYNVWWACCQIYSLSPFCLFVYFVYVGMVMMWMGCLVDGVLGAVVFSSINLSCELTLARVSSFLCSFFSVFTCFRWPNRSQIYIPNMARVKHQSTSGCGPTRRRVLVRLYYRFNHYFFGKSNKLLNDRFMGPSIKRTKNVYD